MIPSLRSDLCAVLGPALTEEQARTIYALGPEAVTFALLHLAAQIPPADAEPPVAPHDVAPTTPSAMVPVYVKPPAKKRRRRPGRPAGHPGSRRPTPAVIHEHISHRAPCCPHCHGPLTRCRQTRTRIIEDIPESITPVVTAHLLHRDWCARCRCKVEPVVPDALPQATLGHRTVVLTAWLHYGLGQTLAQILAVFNFHLHLKLTAGGLVQMWHRLHAVLFSWYVAIQAQALQAAVLHADETGWRVDGRGHWLWCFATTDLSYFMIDRCRGSPALRKFFIQEFAGTLVSDFWGAYNRVAVGLRQTCLVHLLRDLETVEHYHRAGGDWAAFAKKLRRLLGDAIRLWKREGVPELEYASRRQRLTVRLDALLQEPWQDKQARRLVKRLRRHAGDLFTFLDQDGVPFDNNLAERAIRPAVVLRKTSYGNRSAEGADTQAVLMTVYRTLQQRGHDPLQTIVQALRTYVQTGQLPALPAKIAAAG